MRFAYYILTLSIALGSCKELQQEDIKEWINANQKNTTTHTTSLEEQEISKVFTYQANDRIDPFDSKKLHCYLQTIPLLETIFLQMCKGHERR